MIYIIWIPYAIVSVVYLYAILRYRNDYEYKYEEKKAHSPRILFQIMTRGGNQKLIQDNVNIINNINKDINYSNYEISVVTDGNEKYENCNTLNVPKVFKCKLAKYKSRALQYAIEYRRNLSYDQKTNLWILHLDEESKPTRDGIIAYIEFIERNPNKLISTGAINYPISFFKTKYIIPSLIEAERSVGDYYNCLQMNIGYPIYMHGSNLLVRADLEEEIGWEFDSIAEDSCFGQAVSRKRGNVFGWNGGTILEQPAFSIKDMIKQRKRWYYGSLQNLKYLDFKSKVIQLFLLCTWKLGFISGIIGIYAMFEKIYVPTELKLVFIFSTLMWIFTYQYGTYLNMRHINVSIKDRIITHIYCFIMTPILGILSTLPAILAIVDRPKSFDIIKKS